MNWLDQLANALLKIRTQLQLTGFVVLVAGVVATRIVAPGAITAQITAGTIGVLFIVFGQVFSRLASFPPQERTRLILSLFATFCIFVLFLVVVTVSLSTNSGSIAGIVLDENDKPAFDAIVSIDGIPEINDETPKNGNFNISIPANQHRNEYVVRARKENDNLSGTKKVETKNIGQVIEIHLAPAPPPTRAQPILSGSSSAEAFSLLPSGNATLHDGFEFGDESTFAFASGTVLAWGSAADIGVATPPGANLAQFFLPNDLPPYTNPEVKHPGVENSGIIEVSANTLREVLVAPESDYKAHYFRPELGHLYCVRTRDGHHFAKLKITYLGADRIAFDYVYQPSGSRSLADNAR